MDNQTQQCPYCGEEIHADALKCPCCRTWLDGREKVLGQAAPTKQATNQNHDRFESLLDKAAERICNPVWLKWLCVAAIILAIFETISMCVDEEGYYRASLLRTVVWINENLYWLVALISGAVKICILLAIRQVLIRHGIKTWISICIAVYTISYLLGVVTTFASATVEGVAALLEIEVACKMSRYRLAHIKHVGYLDVVSCAWGVVFEILFPLLLVAAFAVDDFDFEWTWIVVIYGVLGVGLSVLIYKMFQKEFPEKL